MYKTIDPRAIHLRDMVCTLDAEAEDPRWCHLSMQVNEVVGANKKGIYPNVDFFSAPLLYTLGVPPGLVHTSLRHEQGSGLDCPCDRAVRRQSAHTAKV